MQVLMLIHLWGTFGAVLRDIKGDFLAAANNKVEACLDALTAETMALRFGLHLVQTVGCNRLVVNSDNVDVISTMCEGDFYAGVGILSLMSTIIY